MEIVTYKKASEIEEKYLSSLVDAEIECWGSRPFDEYKICSNPECRAIYSIEDIYETIDDYRNRVDEKLSLDFKCSICELDTELIYEKTEFLEVLKEYIKWEVSWVLLIDDNEKVEWFGVLSKTSLSWAINYEFATRPGSYDKEDLLKLLSKELFWTKDAGNEQIALLHQIYVSKNLRKWNISFEMLNKLISLNLEYWNIPVIWETRFEGDFYPISRTMGFNDIESDKYWYVVQFLESYSLLAWFLFKNDSFTSKDIFINILKHKREIKKNLKSNLVKQKFYISN